MKAFLACALLLALAVSGCSSSEAKTHTCQKTGQVLTLSDVPGSDAAGFDPETACTPPLGPSVRLSAVPSAVTIYFPSQWSWTVDSGNYSAGHSMATQLRYSHHSVGVQDRQGPESYLNVIQGYAHQDVGTAAAGGSTFTAKWTPEATGDYYVAVYAQVRGEGIPDADYWSQEVKVTVLPVAPTGVTKTVTQNPGSGGVPGTVGGLDTRELKLSLGDAVVFANKDAVEHTFTFKTAPSGFKHDPVKVAAGGASDAIMIGVPGSYSVQTDGLPNPSTVDISATVPA